MTPQPLVPNPMNSLFLVKGRRTGEEVVLPGGAVYCWHDGDWRLTVQHDEEFYRLCCEVWERYASGADYRTEQHRLRTWAEIERIDRMYQPENPDRYGEPNRPALLAIGTALVAFWVLLGYLIYRIAR